MLVVVVRCAGSVCCCCVLLFLSIVFCLLCVDVRVRRCVLSLWFVVVC